MPEPRTAPWWLAVLLLLASPLASALVLPGSDEYRSDITQLWHFYEDEGRQLELNDIRRLRYDFQPFDQFSPAAATKVTTYWLRIALSNTSDRRRETWLSLDNPTSPSVTMYTVDGPYIKQHESPARSLGGMAFKTRKARFVLTVPAQTSIEIYLRVDQPWTRAFNATLSDRHSDELATNINQLTTGVAYGGLLLLILAGLQRYRLLKDISFLLYALLVIAGLFHACVQDGFMRTLFNAVGAGWLITSASLFNIALLTYGERLLRDYPNHPLVVRALWGTAVANLLVLAIAVFSTQVAWYLLLAISSLVYSLLMAAMLRLLLDRYWALLYPLSGLVIYGLFTLPFWLGNGGGIYAVDSWYKIGLLLMMLMFALGQGKQLVNIFNQARENARQLKQSLGLVSRAQQMAQFETWRWQLSDPLFQQGDQALLELMLRIPGQGEASVADLGALLDEKSQVQLEAALRLVASGRQSCALEVSGQANGLPVSYMLQLQVEEEGPGKTICVGLCHDVTERKANEEAEKIASLRWRELAEASFEAVLVVDGDTIVDANPAAEKLLVKADSKVTGSSFASLFNVGQHEAGEFLESALDSAVQVDMPHAAKEMIGELRSRRGWLGSKQVFFAVLRDVTRQALQEQHLRELGYRDSLTGLANRNLLTERVDHAIKASGRQNRIHALLFIDLDNFKNVNDAHGHEQGDSLLVTIAKRIRSSTRRENTVARYGGDEFVIFLEDIGDAHVAANVSEQLLKAISEPLEGLQKPNQVSASIGIAVYPQDAHSLEDLVSHADAAMYQAKSKGRNNYQFYTDDVNRRVSEQKETESSFRRACREKKLKLSLEPVVRLLDKKVVSYRAQFHWMRVAGNKTSLDELYLFGDPLGLAAEVSDFAIESVCKLLAKHRTSGDYAKGVSVKVARSHFMQEDFCDFIKRQADKYKLEPGELILFVDEKFLTESVEENTYKLKLLDDIGITVGIDNFGAGNTSLRLLYECKIDHVRLTTNWINSSTSPSENRYILTSLMDLCHSLDIRVCANINNERELDVAQAIECDLAVGTWFKNNQG